MSAQTLTSLAALGLSRRDQLKRLDEAGMIAQGRVFLLSLEPIRAQLGNRWAAREEIVWETVERALVRRMPAPDVFVRINETTVLAAIASTDSYEGQVMCAEVLRSVLTFFLGRAAEGDVSLARVANLGPSGLMAEAVDLNAPAHGSTPAATDAAPAIANPPERWIPALAGRRLPGLITSDRHGTLAFHLDVVPAWRLDQGIISAYAFRLRLPVDPERLSDGDRERINEQLMNHLAAVLEEYRREGGVFALIIPSFFSVLSGRRPRLAMLARCANVADIMRRVVILEIDGMGPGVPAGLVRETAAMMRPFARALTVAVRDTADTQTAFRENAFNGLAIDGTRVPAKALENLIRSARRRTPNIVVHDAPDALTAEWLRACGASHVTWGRTTDTQTRKEAA